MAKESMKAREVKRLKLVERYAARRSERSRRPGRSGQAAAQLEPDPPAQPLQADGPSERIHAPVRHQPYPVPRNGFAGTDPGREESQLVACGAPCAARPGRRRTKGVPPPDENRTGRFPGSLLTVRFFFLPLPPDFYGSAAEGGHPLPRRPVKQVRSLSPGTQRIQPEGRALCPQSAEGRY